MFQGDQATLFIARMYFFLLTVFASSWPNDVANLHGPYVGRAKGRRGLFCDLPFSVYLHMGQAELAPKNWYNTFFKEFIIKRNSVLKRYQASGRACLNYMLFACI